MKKINTAVLLAALALSPRLTLAGALQELSRAAGKENNPHATVTSHANPDCVKEMVAKGATNAAQPDPKFEDVFKACGAQAPGKNCSYVIAYTNWICVDTLWKDPLVHAWGGLVASGPYASPEKPMRMLCKAKVYTCQG